MCWKTKLQICICKNMQYFNILNEKLSLKVWVFW